MAYEKLPGQSQLGGNSARQCIHRFLELSQRRDNAPVLATLLEITVEIFSSKVTQAVLRGGRIAAIGLLSNFSIVAGPIAVIGNIIARIVAAIFQTVGIICGITHCQLRA